LVALQAYYELLVMNKHEWASVANDRL